MSDLASRITNPEAGAGEKPAANPSSEPAAEAETKPVADGSSATAPEAAGDQVDGTVESLGGSGLHEPEWDVEVSLSDLQANAATPFHSAATWQDLGLYVPTP